MRESRETETDLWCWGLNRISCSEPAVCVLKTELGPFRERMMLSASGERLVVFCDMCTQLRFGPFGPFGSLSSESGGRIYRKSALIFYVKMGVFRLVRYCADLLYWIAV